MIISRPSPTTGPGRRISKRAAIPF